MPAASNPRPAPAATGAKGPGARGHGKAHSRGRAGQSRATWGQSRSEAEWLDCRVGPWRAPTSAANISGPIWEEPGSWQWAAVAVSGCQCYTGLDSLLPRTENYVEGPRGPNPRNRVGGT